MHVRQFGNLKFGLALVAIVLTFVALLPAASRAALRRVSVAYTTVSSSALRRESAHLDPLASAPFMTFTVTNNLDSGPGSLRQAILDANASSGIDTISFGIGSGPATIALAAPLPTITEPLTIDGTTQPGYSGVPLIELDGSNVPLGNDGLITVAAGNTITRGLILNHFRTAGILLSDLGGNHVEGCYIGTNASGTLSTNSQGDGIRIKNSTNNVIGGTTPNSRNVISGNSGSGILISGYYSNGNTIQGNYIGVTASGSAPLGNQAGITIGSSYNLVGGTVLAARNVISASVDSGVIVQDFTAGNVIQGNYVGTDASGLIGLGNANYGVQLFGYNQNQLVGGSSEGSRNVISGNRVGVGLVFQFGPPHNSLIQGNYIGAGADGKTPVGNSGAGIELVYAIDNTVGGLGPGEGNLIAFNGGPGCRFQRGGSAVDISALIGNTIRGNSIFSNGGLGIDLDGDGVTANDAGDSDIGTNYLQNFPTINSVVSSSNQTTISGSLNSTPNKTYAIDFYSSASCDPSGYGQGAAPFGRMNVTTGADGNVDFSKTVNSLLPVGRVITATATDSGGNTSEFSSCDATKTTGSAQLGAANYKVIEDVGVLTVPVLRIGGSLGALTVDYSTVGITAEAGQDFVPISGSLTFANGETSKTLEIAILDDAVNEPEETFALVLKSTTSTEAVGSPGAAIFTVQDHNTVPSLTLTPQSVNEGDSGTTGSIFTVTLSAATGRTVSVDYSSSGVTATAGVDFQQVSGSLTFQPKMTVRSITLPVIGDLSDEPDETFQLSLQNPTNASLQVAGAIGTIVDNDPPPQASIADATVVEGNSGTIQALFHVSLSVASGKLICLQASTADGSATAGTDYLPLGVSLINPPVIQVLDPGTTSANVPVLVKGDLLFEPDESFFVNLIPCNQNVTIDRGQAVGTISNDELQPSPTISVSDTWVSDGGGPANATFMVTLSAPSTQTITAKYATSPGTATAGTDFQSSTGLVTFNPGVTSQPVSIPIVPDSLVEGNETFTLDLSNPENATFSDNLGLATISDGPATPLPSLSVNDITVVEGDSGTSEISFTVTNAHPVAGTVGFSFHLSPGTASPNVDYEDSSGTVLIGPNQTSTPITVRTIGDSIDESDETFFINLESSDPGVTIADAQGMATILDNDAPPKLSVNDVTVFEGDSGTTTANFSLALSGVSGRPLSVDFATANGTATSPSDFVATSGTVTFNPGEVTKTVSVTVNSDLIIEASENFFLNLLNGINCTISDVQGVGTIIDHSTNVDSVMNLSSSTYVVSESTPSVTLTVTRSGATTHVATVKYKTSDLDTFRVNCSDTDNTLGAAYGRCDFATSIDTLTFAAGETAKTFTIPIINDSLVEGDETFSVSLSDPVGASLGTTAVATVRITDDDPTTGSNPIFTTPFFVRQHYLDFLSREPEVGEPWSNVLNNCSDVNNNPACDRTTVSAAFFGSPEFQLKGFYVFRFYKLAFQNYPVYEEIVRDMRLVTGQTPAEVFQKKAEYANAFVARPDFNYSFYPDFLYASALMANYNLSQITTPDPSAPDGTNKVTLTTSDLTNRLLARTLTRAQIFRAIADSDEVFARELNNAFVAMQYYGYLRRTPDGPGYSGWLNYLNAHPSDSRTMVNGFMNSQEYRLRFGPGQ
jgi:hypothetical protein